MFVRPFLPRWLEYSAVFHTCSSFPFLACWFLDLPRGCHPLRSLPLTLSASFVPQNVSRGYFSPLPLVELRLNSLRRESWMTSYLLLLRRTRFYVSLLFSYSTHSRLMIFLQNLRVLCLKEFENLVPFLLKTPPDSFYQTPFSIFSTTN